MKNHRSTSLCSHPEIEVYFADLYKNQDLDAYLREFIFKSNHCRLNFRRYKENINDLLNIRQRCFLCQMALDTPRHLFEECRIGHQLRRTLSSILTNFNCNYNSLQNNQKVYCHLVNKNEKIIQFLLSASNYSIYRIKLKKMFNQDYIANYHETNYCFIKRVKMRI